MEQYLMSQTLTYMIKDGKDIYVLQRTIKDIENKTITKLMDVNAKDITNTKKGKKVLKKVGFSEYEN